MDLYKESLLGGACYCGFGKGLACPSPCLCCLRCLRCTLGTLKGSMWGGQLLLGREDPFCCSKRGGARAPWRQMSREVHAGLRESGSREAAGSREALLSVWIAQEEGAWCSSRSCFLWEWQGVPKAGLLVLLVFHCRKIYVA